MFFGLIYVQGYVALPLEMSADSLGPEQYGAAIAVNGILIVLVGIPVSNMSGKWPRYPAIAAATFLMGLGFGLVTFANNLPFFAFTVGVWTLGEILGSAVAPTIVADLSPIELRGLWQGVFGSMWGISFFLGPLIGGWVFEHFSPAALWIGCFVLGCVLTVAYLALGRLAHKPKTI